MECIRCHVLLSLGKKVCCECRYPVSATVRSSLPSPAGSHQAPVVLLAMRAVAVAVFAVTFLLEPSGGESRLLAAESSRKPSDPLVARLLSTPLPKDSYHVDMDKPEISDDKDTEPGQVGQVIFLTRRGGRIYAAGGFTFTVFKGPAEAGRSYDETIKSDRAQASAAGGSVITLSGITGVCLRGGGTIIACRALAGRTTISLLFPDGEPEQTAVADTQSLVKHVLALDK